MIRFDQVALRRGTRLLITKASFSIHPGHRVGLTGVNGAGKSSLLSALLGHLHVDAGEVYVAPAWVIAYVEQELASLSRSAIDYVLDGDTEYRQLQSQMEATDLHVDAAAFSALQARFESIGGYSAEAKAARLLNGLGFGTEEHCRPVEHFSGGWRMRLGLAQALMCRSDLLLLDEPTNHLDLDAILWLQQWLAGYEGTLVLISHDREFLDAVIDHVLHIENQEAVLYAGNYLAFETRRAERLALVQSQRVKQQRETARIQQFIDRFGAKATKAKQAQSRMKALARMDRIAQAHVDSPLAFAFAPAEKLPAPLLQLHEVSAGYGSRPVVEGFSMSLMPGSRIGLLGRNGAGKTTVMKVLGGVMRPSVGNRMESPDLKIGYFAQHSIEQLHLDECALDHVVRLDRRASERDLRAFLGRFDFSGDRVFESVATFSGGEKARLGLALLIYSRPNLLLLDEPTNHLDLEMRFALVNALQDFDGGLVLVSHDRYLLRSVVDEFWLVENKRVEPFAGDLEDYGRRLQDRSREVSAKAEGAERVAAPRNRRRSQAERRLLLRPLETAFKRADEELERISQDLRRLEANLADPDLYRESGNAEALRALAIEKATAERVLREAEESWLAASDALETARLEVEQ